MAQILVVISKKSNITPEEGMDADVQVCGERRCEIADGANLAGGSKYSNITSECQGG